MRMKFRYITAILLSLCAMVSGAQEQSGKAARDRAVEYYYLHAVSLFEQDSIDVAYDMLEHCLALDPGSLPVNYELSGYYQFMGKDSLAREMLEGIVRKEPSNMRYCEALVGYYMKHDDTESAIAVYEKALPSANQGSKAELCMILYRLYSSIGKYSQAMDMLDKVELLEGSNEEVSLCRIYLHVMLNDSINAVAGIRQIIAANPDNMLYRNLLGEVYLRFDDIENAEKAYLDALKNDPEDPDAQSSLAGIYQITGNDTLFCQMTERLIKNERFGSEQRSALLYEYVMYKEKRDSTYIDGFFRELLELPFEQKAFAVAYAEYLVYREASREVVIPIVERILELDPENHAALMQMLIYAIESNDYGKVISCCDDALLYMPDKLLLYYYKGLAMYLSDDKDAMIPIYEEGLARCDLDEAPEITAQMYSNLGDVYHERGDIEKCFKAYDQALAYQPDNMSVMNNYAYYLSLEGVQLERALEMSAKTLEQEPDDATCIDTYAWILFSLGRYGEAMAYAEKLLLVSDENSSVLYVHCGDIFAMNGDIDRAVEMWMKAQELGDDSRILKKKIKKRKYYPDAKKKRK